MKKKLINLCKKNKYLRVVVRKLLIVRKIILFKIYSIFLKKEDKMIVFSSFLGKGYSDSQRGIYEVIKSDPKYKDYTLVWAFKNTHEKENIKMLEGSVLVKYNSLKYIKCIVKSKYVIDNSRLPSYIKIRRNQVFLQCWHGTPLKRLGYDLEIDGSNALNSLDEMKAKYKEDALKMTHLLSPSKFTSEKLSSAFNLKVNNPDVKLLEVGYPRNDKMYNYTDKDVKDIKKTIDIKTKKKIILYAPTWRDNQHTSGVGYTYDLGVDFDVLQKELSDDYIILFRTHYFVSNMFDFDKYKGFIYDASNYDDIVDLYIIADLLITDYSSVFFDYANMRRPIIFYMYDLDDYKDSIRGFYLDLKELPGNIVQKEKDLIREIKSLGKDFKVDKKYKKFNETFNYLDDGKASNRVVEELLK